MDQHGSKFVWHDDTGLGRSLYCMFRRTFRLSKQADAASISIFADTHYQLWINGEFVEFGPIRFDPRYPVYDTHNIKRYMREGINTIAILVNSIQHKVFRTYPARAGLITWGSVAAGGSIVDLSTKGGLWKSRMAEAYRTAPRLSFALNEAELYDQSKAEIGWTEPSYDDSLWQEAVELKEQSSWGTLEAREIPFMRGTPIEPAAVSVFPLLNNERTYSLYAETQDLDVIEPAPRRGIVSPVVWETWIWSPVEQNVSVTLLWGEHYLNGKRTGSYIDIDPPGFKQKAMWHFLAGWNHYMGKGEPNNAVFQQYIGLPEDRGLLVSADKDLKSNRLLMMSKQTVSVKEYIAKHPLPWEPECPIPDGWQPIDTSGAAQSPCLEYGWDMYGDPIGGFSADSLKKLNLAREAYQKGACILIDLGRMNLFSPRLILKGTATCKIDMIYGEQLCKDGKHIRCLPWVPLGDRALVSDDIIDWRICHVRGARYVAVTIRDISEDAELSIELRSANYPAVRKGRLVTSDPAINAIWEMCARTQEANMEDAYVDCSGRERGMYIRDTIIQYHNNLALFGDQKLMRRCVDLFGQSPDETGKFRAVYPNTGDYTITDFSLNMVEGFLNYYEQTGDKEITARYWPAIQRNLQWFNELSDEREDGLLDIEWDAKRGIKAAYGGYHGDNGCTPEMLDRTGVHAAFTLTYLIALKAGFRLAELLGDRKASEELTRRINKLTASVETAFWDESRGCYTDSDKKISWSIQANALALLAGVISADHLPRVKEHMARSLRSLFVNGYDPTDGAYFSPHFSFYILQALYELDLSGVAENAIRQGWGWMLAQGLVTCPEFFNLQNSLCHAWAASPVYHLSRNLLGVRYPKAPDFDEVAIDIRTSSVEWAEGEYPHPRGVVEIKWHTEGAEKVIDYIKAPAGCKITIV